MVVTVYSDKCNGIKSCPAEGICVKVCARDAIKITDNLPVILDDSCSLCGLCILNCPNEALSKY